MVFCKKIYFAQYLEKAERRNVKGTPYGERKQKAFYNDICGYVLDKIESDLTTSLDKSCKKTMENCGTNALKKYLTQFSS